MPETKHTKEDCVRALLLLIETELSMKIGRETMAYCGYPPYTREQELAAIWETLQGIGAYRGLKRLE